jgi:hypothetical protein
MPLATSDLKGRIVRSCVVEIEQRTVPLEVLYILLRARPGLVAVFVSYRHFVLLFAFALAGCQAHHHSKQVTVRLPPQVRQFLLV